MSSYPQWQAGTRVTAGKLQASQAALLTKSAQWDIVNSATPTNDPDLSFPVSAGGIYLVTFVIFAQSTSTAPDLQTAWNVPLGSTGLKSCIGPTSNSATFTNRTDTNARFSGHNFSTAITYQADTASISIQEQGQVTAGAAGSIGIQLAQAVSGATALSILSSSYMAYQRVG